MAQSTSSRTNCDFLYPSLSFHAPAPARRPLANRPRGYVLAVRSHDHSLSSDAEKTAANRRRRARLGSNRSKSRDRDRDTAPLASSLPTALPSSVAAAASAQRKGILKPSPRYESSSTRQPPPVVPAFRLPSSRSSSPSNLSGAERLAIASATETEQQEESGGTMVAATRMSGGGGVAPAGSFVTAGRKASSTRGNEDHKVCARLLREQAPKGTSATALARLGRVFDIEVKNMRFYDATLLPPL